MACSPSPVSLCYDPRPDSHFVTNAMWLARPIYEILPYLYMLVGLVLLGAAWLVKVETLPSVFMVVGALSLLAGIVLWLRRRDYRSTQAEYTNRTLDE